MEMKIEEISPSPIIEKKNEKIKLSRIVKNPLIILLTILFILFFFHPILFNLGFYFGRSEEPVPMNYVSNFYLWTRNNKKEPQKVIVGARENLKNSNFRNRKTFIIVHGFTCSGLDDWVISMKDALLWREDCNVISVDWKAGSLTAGYYVIQARVPAVGQDISRLVIFLKRASILNLHNLHLVGHSLGAHIVGFAGKYLNSSVSRITGLDPAGLGFSGTSPASRLDKSDAAFVDVIHTHGCYTIINQWTDCYGTHQNMGDADFWPNGGEEQPACDEFGEGVKAVRNGSNCHHGMAYVYYTSSIYFSATSTRFLARECPSWQLFNNGTCPCSSPQYMGHSASPKFHGVFYLNTSKIRPFGILEPPCSPGEMSLFKIIGVLVCALLVVFWFISSLLVLLSLFLKKDIYFSFEKWMVDKASSYGNTGKDINKKFE